MFLSHNAVVRSATTLRSAARVSLTQHAPLLSLTASRTLSRTYASKSKNNKKGDKDEVKAGVTTDSLIPQSQRIVSGPEYVKAEGKMKAALDYLRREVSALEMRASGRVMPAILSPVRVVLPGGDTQGVRLEEVATVGVREGSTLIVTVFDEQTLKYVERALYDAKLPGIVPQKADSRTIKIPVPRPTVDARLTLYTSAAKQAEDTRSQIRKQRDAITKPYKKHDPEYEAYQKLMERYLGEVDKVLADLKKATGAK